MHGTFNGVHLRRITSLLTRPGAAGTLTTFRILDSPLPELTLEPGAPALLILSRQKIEGRIVRYVQDKSGYEITLEAPRAG